MSKFIEQPFTFDRVMRIIFTLLILGGSLYVIHLLKGALLPFLVAWVIAYLIHPLVVFNEKKLRIHNRVISVILALITVVLSFTLAGWIFIPSILIEMDKMGIMIQNFLATSNTLPFLPESWQDFIRSNIDFNQLTKLMNKDDWMALIEKVTTNAWIVITGSVNQIVSIVSWFIVLLYLIFILIDYDKILNGFKDLIPNKYRPLVLGLLSDVTISMNRYFRGQALVAFLVGILFSIGFLIVGLPLAIVLGLFIGLLNMIPYMQIIGVIPTILLCLLHAAETGQNFWILFAACMAVFIVVQLIQDIILTPRIMGKVTGLNPAIILLSLSIWGTLMGVIGMIIALPLTSLMLAYYQKYILRTDFDKADESVIDEKSDPGENETI